MVNLPVSLSRLFCSLDLWDKTAWASEWQSLCRHNWRKLATKLSCLVRNIVLFLQLYKSYRFTVITASVTQGSDLSSALSFITGSSKYTNAFHFCHHSICVKYLLQLKQDDGILHQVPITSGLTVATRRRDTEHVFVWIRLLNWSFVLHYVIITVIFYSCEFIDLEQWLYSLSA